MDWVGGCKMFSFIALDHVVSRMDRNIALLLSTREWLAWNETFIKQTLFLAGK